MAQEAPWPGSGAAAPAGADGHGHAAGAGGPGAGPGGGLARPPRPQRRTPDELRDAAHRRVREGVAAVAGALEGVNDAMSEASVEDATAEAFERLGDLTARMAAVVREEAEQVRQALRPAPPVPAPGGRLPPPAP